MDCCFTRKKIIIPPHKKFCNNVKKACSKAGFFNVYKTPEIYYNSVIKLSGGFNL